MKESRRTISIRKIPAELDSAHQKAFYRELESCINVDRPFVVLDCSMLAQLDRRAIHLLLCCLEDAMKRNGDVRLAALQPAAQAVLKSTGLEAIFQVFDNLSDAVESFRTPHISLLTRQQPQPAQSVEISAADHGQAQESAA
jgi:anti-sigma B factor antagonist